MNRFFVDSRCIQGTRVCLGSEQAHQICHVLRLRPGDRIAVFDATGTEATVVLESVCKDSVQAVILESKRIDTEPRIPVTLYQSMLPRSKFEWVLQKCTEVGCRRVVPVIADRSTARLVPAGKLARWRKILTEATEQSGRAIVPHIGPAVRSLDLFARPGPAGALRLLAASGAGVPGLAGILAGRGPLECVDLCVGPEGGFSPREIDAARSGGWILFSMGRRVLRAETAAIVGCALILYHLEQIGGQANG